MMGLFDFFRRDHGEKVGDSDTPTAEQLKSHLSQVGLPTNGLDIQVADDTVTVRGSTASQEEKEKIAVALGNVKGVSRVDDQTAVTGGAQDQPTMPPQEQPASQTRFHTVEKGDTLSAIAKKVYGDPNRYAAIFEANKPMLKDPDKIYPGQVLRIPPQG
ncbi:peptidoglycan-binding protein LysM [Azospirillum isscasi]|uniref:Peptidoglycan-binding protein LysM n=1 Tax=Azospirillum isscasi TaxID=3053926 RepID=A0ABU0WQL8_9PROT|nr:peptidoglycan-binding protein LysM [Azospirillum isscasi]MDQ2106223.1 peptidoglycan-binding protein LysM [Azospirillum isscasi]